MMERQLLQCHAVYRLRVCKHERHTVGRVIVRVQPPALRLPPAAGQVEQPPTVGLCLGA